METENDMNEGRFAEIDIVRGIAVVAMIIFHALFDLNMIGVVEIRMRSAWLNILAEATAGTFFTIVGLSLYISFSRTKKKVKGRSDLWRKYLIRGGKLLVWGGVITGITYALYPEFVIVFGALQFIGVSVVIAYLLLELIDGLPVGSRLAFISIALIGLFSLSGPVRGIRTNHPFLIWVGLVPSGFQSLDYFPMIPWFGFVLGGLLLGELVYPEGKRRYEVYEFTNRPTEFMGRHSLVIYFLHQPLLYLGIFLFAAI